MKTTLYSGIAVVLLASVLITTYSLNAQGQKADQAAQNKAATAEHPLAADAKKRGVKCVSRVQELTSLLTQNSQFGGHVTVHPKKAQDGIYTAVISRRNTDGGTQLVSLSIAPDKSCTATYEVSTVWAGACEQIGAQLFANYEPKLVLPGGVRLREATLQQQVFLVPLPNGCLTVQKETLY